MARVITKQVMKVTPIFLATRGYRSTIAGPTPTVMSTSCRRSSAWPGRPPGPDP
jgi:hypothetical protein